jgi:hypothetical protein
MYAKKKKKPMYGKGGTVKYLHGGLHGGPVKSDSTNPVKSDSTKMAPLDLFGIDAVLKAREEGPALDLFGIDAVLDAREAAGLSRNPMDDFKPISDKAKAALEKLRVYFGISDEPKKMMKGGMMPKYPGGGMMPRKRGMMMYENGGEVDPDSPEFKEYLEYRMRGSGQPLYFDEYKGEQLSPTELRQMIREQGSSMAIPRSLMPEGVSDRYMNEAMIGYSSGPGGARATMADAMSGAEAMFNQNRKFEQEFLEYMKGKGGAAPRREPGMRLEQTPEGELTNAERRVLASFNR